MTTGVRRTVKFRATCVGLILGFAACAALSFAAQKKVAAGSGVLAQDKGKFTIKLAGQTVGHEEFEIAPSGGGWLAKGTADIKPPEGAASKVTGSLPPQSDGAPISHAWTAPTDTTTAPPLGSATADGKTYESLKVSSSDLEILLFLDNTHRLIRLEVPDAKVSVIRE